MPAVDEMLAALADHPPTEPTPVGKIRGRARRRTRRRRTVAGAAAALVLVAVGAGLGVAVTADDPGQDVHADGGASSTEGQEPTTGGPDGPRASFDPTVTLEPAAGHVVGNRVRVIAIDGAPSGPAVVTQCTAEVLDAAPEDVLSWCVDRGPAEPLVEVPTVPVHGSLVTPAGVIACDDGPGRCVVVVALGDPVGTDLRWAPLVLDGTPPASDERGVVVDGDEGTVDDGDTLLVTVTGVATGEQIFVQQCRTAAHPVVTDPPGSQCDGTRSRSVVVQDGPETQLTFTAFHDLYVDLASGSGLAAGWVACEPCELVVRAGPDAAALGRFPLVLEPSAAPVRPTVAVEPPGAHAPGATVTVRATGLQPDGFAYVGWCPTEPPQGGGSSYCTGPDGQLTGHTVAGDGSLVVADFVLPGAGDEVGADCTGVPGACSVGVEGLAGASAVAIAPLDLTG